MVLDQAGLPLVELSGEIVVEVEDIFGYRGPWILVCSGGGRQEGE
jgi:hypothetical protein